MLRLHLGTGRFRTYATVPDLPACPPGGEPDGCSPNLSDATPVPNHAAWGRDGSLYLTDYRQAGLWRVPPGGGEAEPWFADARLDGILFGTAGLRLTPDRKALMFTQQVSADGGTITQGKLCRLPIRWGRPQGELEILWQGMPTELPDGFGFGRRTGNICLANAGLTNQSWCSHRRARSSSASPRCRSPATTAPRSISTPRPTRYCLGRRRWVLQELCGK